MFKLRTGMTFIAALGLAVCGLVDTHNDTTLQSVTRLTRSDTGAATMAAVQTSIMPSAVENCPPGSSVSLQTIWKDGCTQAA